MVTALTAVGGTAMAATDPALILATQILEARGRIERLIDAFDRDAQPRALRARRELAEQLAPVLANAGDPPELKLVDTLSARYATVMDATERDLRSRERLRIIRESIFERVEALKADPAQRELLARVLQQERERLLAELQTRTEQRDSLQQRIDCIEQEIGELTGAGAAAKKRPARR